MIIDANTHPTPDGRWFNTNLDASLPTLLKQLDQAGIDKAIITPFEGFVSNKFTIESAKKYPDRLIPGISFNPTLFNNLDEVFSEFYEEYDGLDIPIVKLHNRLHQYQLSDPRLVAFLEANDNAKRPFIIFICGLLTSKDIPFQTTPPQLFHSIASRFQKTKFVIMHAGMSWAMMIFEAIKDFPNVSMDLSFVQSKYRETSISLDLKYLCKYYDKRIIFGSDFPEINIMQAKNDFNYLTSDLDEIKLKNIKYQNIQNLIFSRL